MQSYGVKALAGYVSLVLLDREHESLSSAMIRRTIGPCVQHRARRG
jgi:hypothetical protein